MKTWRPDQSDASDPAWGGFFSPRTDRLVSAAAVLVVVAAWIVFGEKIGGGLLFALFMLWVWIGT